jgi:3-deoxy-D-manno-octulosonic-acid transferase
MHKYRISMQSFYNFLSIIGLILYFPFLLMKKGPENRIIFIQERLGLSEYHKTDIWVHAVSVGETLACIPFLKKLKDHFPDKKIIMTTTTYTGQKIAREKFPEADRILYMPLDAVFCIRRAVNLLSPEIFVTVETELWPGLFYSLKKINSRIITLNGRISQKSFEGYKKIKPFMEDLLSNVDFFYMQEKGDAERITALGADKDKVGIMGNFKFDMDMKDEAPMSWLSNIPGKILLAASTHEGEEEAVLNAFRIIKDSLQDTKLIIAPRHPERFNETAELIEKKGFSFVRRSAMDQQSAVSGQRSGETGQCSSFPDVVLLDTIGELSRVFSRAEVAFIGGSLVPRGGHNIMEPAYWGRPIIFGPHMNNFPIAGEFLSKSAAQEIRNPEDMAKAVIELLSNSEKAADMGLAARAIVDKNTGAVNKAIELIRGYIGTA